MHSCSVIQSCLTLCEPLDYSLPGSSVHGISQARYWSGLSFPTSGDLPNPGIEPNVGVLAGRFFITESFSFTTEFSSVQSLSRVRLFATPLIAARQASLPITNSQSSLRLTSIESVMPSSHLILCRPLLFLFVHGVLKARILKWFVIPFSSGPHSVRSLHHDLPVLGCPMGMA